MRAISPVVMLALSVVGCSDSAVERAKSSLAGEMFDPSSVQFRDLEAFNQGSSVFVCGKVNAKNRMGGYVGFRGFVYDDRSGETTFEPVIPIVPPDPGSNEALANSVEQARYFTAKAQCRD